MHCGTGPDPPSASGMPARTTQPATVGARQRRRRTLGHRACRRTLTERPEQATLVAITTKVDTLYWYADARSLRLESIQFGGLAHPGLAQQHDHATAKHLGRQMKRSLIGQPGLGEGKQLLDTATIVARTPEPPDRRQIRKNTSRRSYRHSR